MAQNQTPIVGEPFKDYVNSQITARQKIYGSGFSSNRTPEQMTYLNSNVPWIKMASSVDLSNDNDGKNRLKKLGLGGDYAKGTHLAKQSVLFNGLTPLDGNMRAGVAQSNTLINNSAYGFGGTEFGLKSLPGITSIDITPVNRGSIKQANVNIKAYNKFQFELIETLYLRLGFTIMLEWGNSIYVDNNNNVVRSNTTLIDDFFFNGNGSHLDVLSKIEQQRQSKQGNYDALFAKVANFNWTYQPDGSYDISIKLTSLGDVVESFKVNLLPPNSQIDESKLKGESNNGDDITDDKVNQNAISNFLQVIKSKYTDEDFNNRESGVIKINEKATTTGVIFTSSTPLEGRLYMRLGTLLEFIEKEILIHMSNGTPSSCFPMFYINTSTDCIMKSKPKLISVEPQTCIIRPNFRLIGIETPKWTEVMNDFDTGASDGSMGFIHNVYLNFSFIEKILSSNIDKEGNLSFYSFLTGILGGINRSLSNICNLETTINEEKNELIIRDQKLAPRLTKSGILPDSQKSNIIEVAGFNGDQSNFVKGYSFKTQITSKLATTISIGATANNNVANEDATAFSKWNNGLIDRFNQSSTIGTPDACVVKKPSFTPTEKPKPKDFPWEVFFAVATPGLYNLANSISGWFSNNKEKNENNKKLREEWNNSLDTYLQACFSERYTKIKGGMGQGGKQKTESFMGKKYFQNDPDFIQKGKNILKNYVTIEDIVKSEEKNKPTSNIGFIPIELSLDIIGMSGIKIYNQLRLNTDFLPYNYPKVMEFVVMGINHKVDSSGWSTSINAIAKPKSE
jgi:hypothetical protein